MDSTLCCLVFSWFAPSFRQVLLVIPKKIGVKFLKVHSYSCCQDVWVIVRDLQYHQNKVNSTREVGENGVFFVISLILAKIY